MKRHVTVLTEEAIQALAINESSVVVDATLGSAGHAQLVTSKLGTKGIFVGIDADEDAVSGGEALRTKSTCAVYLSTGNFRNIDSILDLLHIEHADAILADLGWRMEQFSGNGRGFSFLVDEPLIMTFGHPKNYPFVAADIVNDWKEEDIKNVLKGYGEERFSGRIARTIVERRKVSPITTTFELAEIIESAVPSFYRKGKINPSTKTFQALRIAVNDEFDALEEFIKKSIQLLRPKGRLAIISFHSLEDRIVKHLYKNFAHDHIGIIHTKKPIVASEIELKRNPRARSAKLRIFEKI